MYIQQVNLAMAVVYTTASLISALGMLSFITNDHKCTACGDDGNLALNKPAFQISTYTTLDGLPSVASRAVDGNTATVFYQCLSCTATLWETNPWWMVDLQQNYSIERVEVTNRGDNYGHRLRNAQILVGLKYDGESGLLDPKLCARIHAQADSSTVSYPCENPTFGRYVMIKVMIRDHMNICEVKVFGPPAMNEKLKTEVCETQYKIHRRGELPTFAAMDKVKRRRTTDCAQLCGVTTGCLAFAVETLGKSVVECYLYNCNGAGFTQNANATFYMPVPVVNYDP